MRCDTSKMEEIGSFSFPKFLGILDDVDIFKCHTENIINFLRGNIGAILEFKQIELNQH